MISLGSQIVGMNLPRSWFNYKSFPFRAFPWERGGRIYERINIRSWKTKVPDVSKHVKSMLPKSINTRVTSELAERMLAETCVAETVHGWLAVLGWGCVLVWRSKGGVIMGALYALGNVPFILIQRYNRPRQAALADALKERGR